MAMIMFTLWLGWIRAARATQRSFFGENVARCKFGRAAESQIFPHRVRWICHCKPRTIETARRMANPMRNTPQSALLGQILSDCAYEGVKPTVAGQFRLALDRGKAILNGFRQVERIDEFGQDDIARRTSLNAFDRFSQGIWAHRPLPCDSCSSTGTAAFQKRQHSVGSIDPVVRWRPPRWKYRQRASN